jgi:formylmethanofuran dehydrogenase subunit A
MTSDEFFTQNTQKFDIIFIDGLHLDYQVTKDIDNAIEALNPNGSIVLHDCYPLNEFAQREVYEVNGTFPAWNGTTWKAFVRFRTTKAAENYNIHTIDTDHGCAILTPGKSDMLTITDELEYANLKNNRYEWLNLISENRFVHLLGTGEI